MSRVASIVIALLVSACFLIGVAGVAYWLFSVPKAEAQPVVLIQSPAQGDEVQVGEAVVVQASARDEAGVVRVELWVDGQLHEAQRSTVPEGTSPFPLVTRWEPSSPGTHTLVVRAFNAEDARAHASIGVEALDLPDRDGDGVADEDDSCPDEAGMGTAAGCPDADGDGVADTEDACPGEVGTVEGGGCPLAAESDRDGDGLLDGSDACPDEPGPQMASGCADADGDGMADADDACPSEAGLRQLDGCPGASDLDGDGVYDEDDDCPAEPGLPEQGGCPDTDGDGVTDPDDLLPGDAGEAADHGAPDTGAPDSDGDGLPDDVDRCDEEAGPVEHEGCPPPGAGADSDGDGVPDDVDQPGGGLPLWPPPGGALPDPMMRLDVEALGFQTYDDYDEISCYVGVAGGPMERYGPFELEAERQWDIAALLGGESSRVILLPTGEDLEVRMECVAYQISLEVTEPQEGFGEVAGEEVVFDLGSLTEVHPAEDWDGRILMASSAAGAMEDRFTVTYRICADSCEETGLPAPHISYSGSLPPNGERWLAWTWTGDPESIEGFRAHHASFSPGSLPIGHLVTLPKDQLSMSIQWYEPLCYETSQWDVTAYNDTTGINSPRSNIVIVDVGPCGRGRTATVSFDWFAPAPYLEGSGPIYGEFWANDQVLSFDGADPAECDFYGEECGYYIQAHEVPQACVGDDCVYIDSVEREVAELFRSIRDLLATWPLHDYDAPDVNYVTVDLPEGEDLTIGVDVWEFHNEGEDTLLCSERCTVDYDDLEDTNVYPCPDWSAAAPCRVEASMSVVNWFGEG